MSELRLSLSKTDRSRLRALAARMGISPEEIALRHLRELLDAEVGPKEESTPGTRRQAAAALIQRLGVDPNSAEWAEAQRQARLILDEADGRN